MLMNAGLMLGQHCRRWANTKRVTVRCIVFDGKRLVSAHKCARAPEFIGNGHMYEPNDRTYICGRAFNADKNVYRKCHFSEIN